MQQKKLQKKKANKYQHSKNRTEYPKWPKFQTVYWMCYWIKKIKDRRRQNRQTGRSNIGTINGENSSKSNETKDIKAQIQENRITKVEWTPKKRKEKDKLTYNSQISENLR